METEFEKGRRHFLAQRYDDAFACFRNATEADSTDHTAWNALGITCTKRGNVTAADACYEKALQLDPGNMTYRSNREKNARLLSPVSVPSGQPGESRVVPYGLPAGIQPQLVNGSLPDHRSGDLTVKRSAEITALPDVTGIVRGKILLRTRQRTITPPLIRVGRVLLFFAGVGLVLGGWFLVAGNRSGTFRTFPFAGYITSAIGFILIAVATGAKL